MNNADMPAMPQTVIGGFGSLVALPGLSKREYFAGLAMQAFITADYKNGSEKRLNEDNALMAVDAADALLNQLQATEDGDE